MNEILLRGCHTRPLGSYLKALGTFRIIGEQADSDVRAAWRSSGFTIRTSLTEEQLIAFFLDEWQPSPIIAPWNGGSGFYPKDYRAAIDTITESAALRLQSYRKAIDLAKEVLEELGQTAKPDKESKPLLIQRLRNELADDVVRWIDAALLITSDSVRYPALLGTGGNDGRLEFTNNFMQRLLQVIGDDGEPDADSERLLRSALFGDAEPGLKRATVGFFSPTGTGGPNATSGFEGAEGTNSWDYVLMLEGTMMFSAAATRRSESSGVRVSYPFSVESSGSGSGATSLSDDSSTRAEIWMPEWNRLIGLREGFRLFSDGRLTVGQRTARDGVDAVRAVGQYGVDRGLTAFERFQFAQRNGLSYLATSLGRIEVTRQPMADLIADLENRGWLERVRRAGRDSNAPASLTRLVRRLEDVIFELSERGGTPALERLLSTVGEIHRLIGRSRSLQETLRPLLLPPRWGEELGSDSSSEMRVALALGGVGGSAHPIRENLLPLSGDGAGAWAPDSTSVVEAARLDRLLERVIWRRVIGASGAKDGDEVLSRFSGVLGCDLDSWLAFAAGELDDQRVQSLLYGLCLVRMKRFESESSHGRRPVGGLALLKLTVPHFMRTRIGEGVRSGPRGSLIRLREVLVSLRSGRPQRAIEQAELHLRMSEDSKFRTTNLALSSAQQVLTRSVAALLVPLDQSGWRHLEEEVIEENQEKEEVTA